MVPLLYICEQGGSKSSFLQSRSITEGRAEFRAVSDCSDWPKTGTSTPHDQTRWVYCPDLGDKAGSMSTSWPKTAASTPHDQTRWVYCPDLGDQVWSIVQILATTWLDHLGGHFLSQITLVIVVRVDLPINGYLIVHQGYLLRRPETM